MGLVHIGLGAAFFFEPARLIRGLNSIPNFLEILNPTPELTDRVTTLLAANCLVVLGILCWANAFSKKKSFPLTLLLLSTTVLLSETVYVFIKESKDFSFLLFALLSALTGVLAIWNSVDKGEPKKKPLSSPSNRPESTAHQN